MFYHNTFNSGYLKLVERLTNGHMMVSGDGKVQTNMCLFIKAGPVCVKSPFILLNKVAEAGQD